MATKGDVMRKDVMLKVRLTNKDYQMLKILAQMYAGGDISKWVRHCIFNAEREVIKKPPHSEG